MIASFSVLLLASVAIASPIVEVRTVASLDQTAFAEAQQRDNTATRAFSSTEIKTSDGQCVFVDELSGDFRANLLPIQVGKCDGSAGQKWDVITAGKHNDQPGTMLVVSSLTQGCMNFDPRRAAGNQVIIFSCGGRADGGGAVTNSQLFSFAGGAGPLALTPLNAQTTCFTVAGAVIDQAACNAGDAKQSFTFGGNGAAAPASASAVASSSVASSAAASSVAAVETSSAVATSPAAVATDVAPVATPACVSTTMVTVTRFIDVTGTSPAATAVPETLVASSAAPAVSSSSDAPAVSASSAAPATTAAPGASVDENPTTPVPVSRAGGVLQPSAVAESQKRDDTATRALSAVQIKDADGQCLFVDPTAGDFRENLIPIGVRACTGGAAEKWDFITKGVHNDQVGQSLIVSTLMNGCMNLDLRRAAGDQVIMFSCGGRADGNGGVQSAQLFPFTAGQTSLPLAPVNEAGKTCLVPLNGKLDQTACNGAASQVFTVG